ncbi:hypothetical protein ACN20G_23320 [Streptomyces sp. BI20]|uniref:hypothetical protein n=1 Tax=Streptomyces sp. BI20 TaxID=3403460 RepID=UPI003C770670
MSVIIDIKFSEFAREYAERQRWSDDILEDFAQAAREACFGGFGIVSGDGMGTPLEAYNCRGYYGCDCTENLAKVNAEETLAAFKRAGVDTYEYDGWIMWDASNAKGHAIAESIGNTLSDYPVLNDEMLSDLEWENACKVVEDLYTLPDGVEVGDVINAMPEVPFCSNCASCDVPDALESLGYVQCSGDNCEEWFKADDNTTERLCYECADYEQEGECECVPVYVDTLKHMSLYPTPADIREIKRGCETCYPVLWIGVSLISS